MFTIFVGFVSVRSQPSESIEEAEAAAERPDGIHNKRISHQQRVLKKNKIIDNFKRTRKQMTF